MSEQEGKKEEILLIYPHQSAQPTAPYQPKNTRLTIILASGNYLDCSNLNPSGNSSESRLILTNYKFNSYKTNYNASNIKIINPFTSKETILYKDEVGNFISQDKKYSYNSANKIVLSLKKKETKTNTEKITNVKKELTELKTLVDKEKETIFEKVEDYNEISQLIKTNLATTEVTQTATTTNNSNTTTEQAQHTQVVEVPTPQRSRGTTTYTPPRVQNSPTAPSRNSDSSATVTPPAPVTPTTPAVSETTGTSE